VLVLLILPLTSAGTVLKTQGQKLWLRQENELIEAIEQHIHKGEVQQARELIQQAVRAGVDLRGRHINFAHYLLTHSDWPTINAMLPPGTNGLAASGLLDSLQGPKPINAQGAPIPWLTYPAIDFLDAVVRKEWLVCEFGAGNSTLWWAQRVAQVHSIEADGPWFSAMQALVPGNVTLSLQTTDDAYVQWISAYPLEHFDAIIVDGGPRPRCIAAAVPHLKKGGVLLVDNSDIAALNESIQGLDSQGFFRLDFWGLVPCYLYKNCTSAFFRDPQFLRGMVPPSMHQSSVGMSCAQIGNAAALSP
jgi:hypothetical protein